MPERTFNAKLEFGGQIDPSLKKSFEEFKKHLGEIREKTAEVSETLRSMQEGLVEFGIALLGIHEAKSAFDGLIDAGKEFLSTQFEINDAIERQYTLLGRSPKAIAEAREELEKLADVLEKKGIYGKGITEKIEGTLKADNVSVIGIKAITPRVESYFARRGKYNVTPEEAAQESDAIAKLLFQGKASPEAAEALLGHHLSRIEQTTIKKLALQGEGPLQAWLEKHMESDKGVWKSLWDARNTDLGKQNVLKNTGTDIAEQAGKTLIHATSPLTDMLNTMMGNDPTGEGSPIMQLLHHIDGWSDKFDAWVKGPFKTDWEQIKKVFDPDLTSSLEKLDGWIDKIGKKLDHWLSNVQQIKDAWNLVVEPKTPSEWWEQIKKWGAELGREHQKSWADHNKRASEQKPGPGAGYAVSPTSIYDTFPAFASGGIVSSPTFSLIGESGPEAILPLSGDSGLTDRLLGMTGAAQHAAYVRYGFASASDSMRDVLDIFKQLPDLASQIWGVSPITGQVPIGGGSGGLHLTDLTGADGSLAVREEYDSEGRSSQYGPLGNRLVSGWNFLGLNPETMAKYGLHQGDFVRTEAGWAKIQESASRRGTIEFHAGYPGQFQSQRSRLHILDTRKSIDGGPLTPSRSHARELLNNSDQPVTKEETKSIGAVHIETIHIAVNGATDPHHTSREIAHSIREHLDRLYSEQKRVAFA
jgi:hypothetical protein